MIFVNETLTTVELNKEFNSVHVYKASWQYFIVSSIYLCNYISNIVYVHAHE